MTSAWVAAYLVVCFANASMQCEEPIATLQVEVHPWACRHSPEPFKKDGRVGVARVSCFK